MSEIQIDAPRHFRSGERLILNLFSLLAVFAIPAMVMVFTLMLGPLFLLGFPIDGVVLFVTLALSSAVAIAGLLFFYPVIIGNPYVARIVSKYPTPAPPGETFLVQATMSPRLATDLDAIVEDADDFGWLELDAEELRFTGDHLKLTVPYAEIATVRIQNIGWRGLWLIGNRVTFDFGSPLQRFDRVAMAAREGSHLIAVNMASRRLTDRVRRLPLRTV